MAQPSRPPTLLIISQVYVPDPAAVGQHMHSAAAEMARRGWRVVVFASRRGYDDPAAKYLWRQTLDGVDIRRFPLASFGKGSIAVRLLAGFIFVAQCALAGLFVRRLSAILVSTSPPMAPLGAVLLSLLRRAPIKYWAMDLNPDQMIAMGLTKPTSTPARVFDWMNRRILKRAAAVVALDRFMGERLEAKTPVGERMAIMPPWPHEEVEEPLKHEDNPFRVQHGLEGRFVVMYSGNHSIVHPITTVLEAAKRLRDDDRFVFMFIGGGLAKRDVEQAIASGVAPNVRSLPYQPLETLRYSLSAADVHVVSVGDNMVGIVHPCKIYGAMAVGRPILLIGPDPCHASDILRDHPVGWHIKHGDVDGAVKALREMADADPAALDAMGRRAANLVATRFSKPTLMGAFCDTIERTMRRGSTHATAPGEHAEQTCGTTGSRRARKEAA